MNNDSEIPTPINETSIPKATYQEQLVPRYRGNPAIEALPGILSAEKATMQMAHYPARERDAHTLPPEIRLHLLMDAMRFFQPLSVHIDLEQRVSRVIRGGYVGRNPVATDHWREIDRKVAAIGQSGVTPPGLSTVNGFGIIGIPGIGKTTGIERVLQTYPQVIGHQSYREKRFDRTQVVWLKLICPHDGSIKGLCLSFFRAMDALLRTNYSRDYASHGRRTVDDLIEAMSRVAAIHCLGLLVIDEIQHLNQAKSGGAERMLNFFLQLMNTLGLPVIWVGTYAALDILSRELRQIRRSSGQGDLIWDRMKNDGEWRMFAETLWLYQYTKNQVPLDQDLNDTLYDESAGIIDFAVKMFLMAQARAIVTGGERLTPAIIRSVARDSFRMAQPALSALRKGDMSAVATMTDLHPIDFQSAIQEIRKTTLLQTLAPASQVVSDIGKEVATAASVPTTRAGGQNGGSTSVSAGSTVAHESPKASTTANRHGGRPSSAKTHRPKNGARESKCLLVQHARSGVAAGQSAHEALLRTGLISPLFKSNPVALSA